MHLIWCALGRAKIIRCIFDVITMYTRGLEIQELDHLPGMLAHGGLSILACSIPSLLVNRWSLWMYSCDCQACKMSRRSQPV